MKLIAAIIVTFLAGMAVAIAGGQGGAMVGTISVFLLCGLAAFAVNWLVYIPAITFKTEKYFDITGSLTYLTVIALACALSGSLDLRSGLVAAMVVIWTLRLGFFLFRRISADGKDGRFDRIKTSPLRFLLTWTLQGSWVVFTSASALMIITSDMRLPLDAFLVIGFALWLAGFLIEAVSDNQKSKFRKSLENKDRFINTGLWAWSRHPNYFGEILLWTGVTVMSLPLLTGWQWATLISPIFVAFLLMRVSGVPMLESKARKKWGDQKDYQDYVAKTPVLIPRPPKG